MPNECRICGCTEHEPCIHEGQTCGWAEDDLCDFCAALSAYLADRERQGEPIVLVTEHEADLYIRAQRAAAGG